MEKVERKQEEYKTIINMEVKVETIQEQFKVLFFYKDYNNIYLSVDIKSLSV